MTQLKLMNWGLSIGLMVLGVIMGVLAWGWVGWLVGGLYFGLGLKGFTEDIQAARVRRAWGRTHDVRS
jgi:hypothetical protein